MTGNAVLRVRGGPAPIAQTSDRLTHVELTWIEKRIENWIRFGQEVRDEVLDRRRHVFSYRPGSVFAFVRYFGIDQTIALTIHAIVALAAITLTWIAWSRDWEEQIPILAAATLLVPPYLLTYDALLMIVPIGFWVRERPRPHLAGLLWLLCFLPISLYFHMYRGPNTVCLAAILSLCVLTAGRRQLLSFRAPHMDNAHAV